LTTLNACFDEYTQVNITAINSSFEDLNDDLRKLKIFNFLYFAFTWLPWSTPIFMGVFWVCFARHSKINEVVDLFRYVRARQVEE